MHPHLNLYLIKANTVELLREPDSIARSAS